MNLPQIRRLLVEDFLSQKEWIAKLFTPLNNFMDGVQGVLDRGITLRENCAADIIKVTMKSVPTDTNYQPLKWGLAQPPISVHIGNITRVDLATFTLAAAVNIQWSYDSTRGFRITNIVGLTPSEANQYVITLVVFTG